MGNYNVACHIALKDIGKDIRSRKLIVRDKNKDVWVVMPYLMKNKRVTRLNRDLGIHVVNKKGNPKMARYTKGNSLKKDSDKSK